MKTLHVSVVDKVAAYQQRDGDIVCGNSDYQIQFTFDSEWDAYPKKTARFIWNGRYYDVDFSGDICSVPVINNARYVTIGVYAKEVDDSAPRLETTTSADIPCRPSILCVDSTPHPETGQNYTTEAQAAAESAKAYAVSAEESARHASEAATEAVSDVKKSAANAIRGRVSGTVISMKDVSPIEHEVVVSVSGENIEDLSAIKLYAQGKNFFNNDTSLIKEVTYASKSGNKGTRYGYELHLPAGEYVMTLSNKVSTSPYVYTVVNDKYGSYKNDTALKDKYGQPKADSYFLAGTANSSPLFYTANDGDVLYIYDATDRTGQYNGLNATKDIFANLDIQVEAGVTATEYEPYIEAIEYSVESDGTVKNVLSLYPSTTLTTDTDGVLIECEYNKDLNKVLGSDNPEYAKKSEFDLHVNNINRVTAEQSRDITRNSKRITNLEKGVVSDEMFVTSRSRATQGYCPEKIFSVVPEGACPYAELKEVGTFTATSNLATTTNLGSIKITGSNLLDLANAGFIDFTTNTPTADVGDIIEVTENGSTINVINNTYAPNIHLDISELGEKIFNYASMGSGTLPFYISHGKQTITEIWQGDPIYLRYADGTEVELPVGTTKIERLMINENYKPVSIRMSCDYVYNLQISFAPPATTPYFEGVNYNGNYTVYTPYKETVIEIPEEVRAIEGYGEHTAHGLGCYFSYSYIDFENSELVFVDGSTSEDTVPLSDVPIIRTVDISEHIFDYNFIEVDAGGMIETINEDGVAEFGSFTIIYQVKEVAE